MGSNPVLGWAGLVLAGMTLAGCETERPFAQRRALRNNGFANQRLGTPAATANSAQGANAFNQTATGQPPGTPANPVPAGIPGDPNGGLQQVNGLQANPNPNGLAAPQGQSGAPPGMLTGNPATPSGNVAPASLNPNPPNGMQAPVTPPAMHGLDREPQTRNMMRPADPLAVPGANQAAAVRDASGYVANPPATPDLGAPAGPASAPGQRVAPPLDQPQIPAPPVPPNISTRRPGDE